MARLATHLARTNARHACQAAVCRDARNLSVAVRSLRLFATVMPVWSRQRRHTLSTNDHCLPKVPLCCQKSKQVAKQ